MLVNFPSKCPSYVSHQASFKVSWINFTDHHYSNVHENAYYISKFAHFPRKCDEIEFPLCQT